MSVPPAVVVDRDADGERAPKQERSRATRAALLSATVTRLATHGWAATTVGNVAEDAGVSRGAAQHHFPTREDLIAATLESMLAERAALIAAVSDPVPADAAGRVELVVRTVVEHYTGDLFKAALQVWAAAASDPALRERVVPIEARISREVFAWAAGTIGVDLADEPSRRRLQLTLDLARGLGLADTLSDDSGRRERIVRRWSDDLADGLVLT